MKSSLINLTGLIRLLRLLVRVFFVKLRGYEMHQQDDIRRGPERAKRTTAVFESEWSQIWRPAELALAESMEPVTLLFAFEIGGARRRGSESREGERGALYTTVCNTLVRECV